MPDSIEGRTRPTTKVIDLVAGARPNFMKLAPVLRAIKRDGRLTPRIVHTGQHYDAVMNEVFFEQLEIPKPDIHLDVGSGSHGQQTAKILERYEHHLLSGRPNATVVFGDVNSTIACALGAVKLGVPTIHVEAGLRSFDRSMPEEINRILTDSISELLLVSEESGLTNLADEGVDGSKVELVGNVMIDTLVHELEKVDDRVLESVGVRPGEYALLTMHRPSNVDDESTLRLLVEALKGMAEDLPVVFPVHPRTRGAFERFGLTDEFNSSSGMCCVEPLSYRDNLALMKSAKVVLTDSGGMQEESSYLKVPCITLRENTERPVTIDVGTSRLVGNDPNRICEAWHDALDGQWNGGSDIPLWDGHAAERVADAIVQRFL